MSWLKLVESGKGGNTEAARFTPDTLIAGTVPMATGADPLTVAYHAAAFALDTERVKLCLEAVGDRVHYLAAAASDFGGVDMERPVGTTLAGILDRLAAQEAAGTPLAFLDTDDVGTTAVVFHERTLSAYRGFSALVESMVRERFAGVEVVDVSQERVSRMWQGQRAFEHQAARRVQKFSLGVAASISAVAMGTLTVLTLTGGTGSGAAVKLANESILQRYSEAAQRANAPMLSAAYTFYEVQRLANLTTDSGGWIERFVQDNQRVAWEIRLPKWVTQEMLAPLGGDIRIKREGELLVVRRGILDREDEVEVAAAKAEKDIAHSAKQGNPGARP